MQAQRNYSRFVAGLAAGIAVGLFVSGVAYALTANVFRYSTQRKGWLGIPPAAMSPARDGLDYGISVEDNVLFMNSGNGCFVTGVNLPHAARLTGMTIWYRAYSGGGLVVELDRNRDSNGAQGALVFDTIADPDSTDRTAKSYPLSAAISNLAQTYGLTICLNTTMAAFHGARLTYTYKTAGD